jgi:hypothetical protein
MGAIANALDREIGTRKYQQGSSKSLGIGFVTENERLLRRPSWELRSYLVIARMLPLTIPIFRLQIAEKNYDFIFKIVTIT